MADSSDQIINSLTDIPAVLEDWDTPALGSGKIYYRKTSAKIGSATPAQNYQTALNLSLIHIYSGCSHAVTDKYHSVRTHHFKCSTHH